MTSEGISPVPREARPYQGHRAGLVSRMAVAAIDTLVVGGIVLAGYLGFSGLIFMFNPLSFSWPKASPLLSLTFAMVLAVLYLAAGWSIRGRTYGSHLMGLRVVNYRGKTCRPIGALIRAVFCVFVPIGLLWCGLSRTSSSLQDVALRTSVIYDWQPRPAGRRTAAALPVPPEAPVVGP